MIKRPCTIINIILTLVLLVGCAPANHETESEKMIPSSSEWHAPVSVPAESGSNAASSYSVSDEIPAANTDTPTEPVLQFYDSFRDIPFVEIEYGTYGKDGSVDKGSLDKGGEPWCAAPGMMEFGERCFTDGTRLWIQVYLFPEDGFDWFQVCFEHLHEDESVWIDSVESTSDERISRDRLFTYADGYTVYTEDGFSFTVKSCSY